MLDNLKCKLGFHKPAQYHQTFTYADGTQETERFVDIVEQARLYIHTLGGFEKFAEWGLIRPNTDL